MKPKRIFLLTGLIVVIAAAAIIPVLWPNDTADTARGRKPNILLITFDTTRADHIGAYGWPHARTPAVDGLAKAGIVFTQAYAPVPLTLPSHTAIMTGLYPFYNGVRDNSQFQLDPRAATLAEALREHGYQTGAMLAAFVLDARFGLDQGFDEYRDDMPERAGLDRFQIPERNAAPIVDDAIDWLEGRQRDAPFFLWCHFYDPHHPYLTPESFPFCQGHPYDQEIAFADHHLRRLLDHLEQSPSYERPLVVVLVGDHGEALGQYGEETHGHFVYDATLQVPLVIRLPDGTGGGTQVDSPVSVVDIMPTILELAGLPVPQDDEIHGRSLVELVKGVSGAAEEFRRRPIYFECFSPMYNFGWAPLQGIRLDQAKFIRAPIPELYLLGDNPREGQALNVLEQHPDLAQQMIDTLQHLLDAPLRRPRLSGEMEDVDPEVIQKLLALGYLGGNLSQQGDECGPIDDPKSRLPLYNLILSGGEQLGGGNIAAGTRLLLEALQHDPDNPRAIWLLAEAVVTDPEEAAEGLPVLEAAAENEQFDESTRAAFLVNCGRTYLIKQDPAKSLAYFQRAVDLQGENPVYRGWLGVAHMHAGQIAEALAATRQGVEQAPQADYLRVQLGLLQFCSGRSVAGADTWQGVLARQDNPLTAWDVATMCAHDPVIASQSVRPLIDAATDERVAQPVRAAIQATAGQVLLNSGQHEAALSALQTACSLMEPDDAQGLWWRSRALTTLERTHEARQLLDRAYELDPDNIMVVADLANLTHQDGNGAGAVQLLSAYCENHSDDPTAANNLAWMLAEHATQDSELDRALQLAKYAVKHRRSSAVFADTLGWVHLKREDGESAIFSFSRAVQLQPRNAEFQYHLGLACRLDGQLEQARDAFAEAVALAPVPRPDWFDEARAGATPTSTDTSESPRE